MEGPLAASGEEVAESVATADEAEEEMAAARRAEASSTVRWMRASTLRRRQS